MKSPKPFILKTLTDNIKAVIFDKDGVIINSSPANIKSVKQAFKKVGVKITKEETEKVIGVRPEDYKDYFMKKYSFNYEEFEKNRLKGYNKLIESSPIIKKTTSLIHELKKTKIKTAISTSSNKPRTMKILKKAKLSKSFDVITTMEDVRKLKPNPEAYLITAKNLKSNQKIA